MSNKKSSDKRPTETHNSKGPNRRAVLKGLGGFCVALPFMELFASSKAHGGPSEAIPKRYMIGFGGCSTGIDGGDKIVPAAEGALAGQLTQGLLPLGDLDMTDSVSLVSGLEIPYGASAPAGGRRVNWHATSLCPLLSGVRSNANSERIDGPTSDWIAANALAGPTASTRPVLAYRVQPAYYRGQNGTGGGRGIISARMNGNNLEQVTPQLSPQTAYQNLFSGFIPPDPQEAARATRLLNRRQSVIDLVRGDTERLLPKLGRADKIRLERHFDELRGLENRLEQVQLPDGSSCKILTAPGTDPEIGGAVENGDTGGYAENAAYSDEDLRATLMTDFVHMAYACDLSRVASICYTYSQCFLNMNPLFGHASDLHEIGHYSLGGGDTGQNGMADGVAWHLKHFTRLAKLLKDTQDIDGSSMLDNTSMVLAFEGGWGYDPEQDRNGGPHSSENMIMFIAGKSGGLNQAGGTHIRATGQHPTKVINTALKAVGVDHNMGEVNGIIPGLLA